MANFNNNYNNNYKENKNYNQNGAGSRNFEQVKLPENYLTGGYYSDAEKEKLKKEYIIEYAKAIAECLETDGGKEANKRTQIRKFYDYVLRVNNKMQMQGNDFDMVEADLAELLPHVTYAKERKVVSEIFQEFIEKNLAEVKDERDLRAFMKHFEAVVAFTKKD